MCQSGYNSAGGYASYGSYLELLYRAGSLPWEEPNWEFDTNAPVTRTQFAVTLQGLLEPDAR